MHMLAFTAAQFSDIRLAALAQFRKKHKEMVQTRADVTVCQRQNKNLRGKCVQRLRTAIVNVLVSTLTSVSKEERKKCFKGPS